MILCYSLHHLRSGVVCGYNKRNEDSIYVQHTSTWLVGLALTRNIIKHGQINCYVIEEFFHTPLDTDILIKWFYSGTEFSFYNKQWATAVFRGSKTNDDDLNNEVRWNYGPLRSVSESKPFTCLLQTIFWPYDCALCCVFIY